MCCPHPLFTAEAPPLLPGQRPLPPPQRGPRALPGTALASIAALVDAMNRAHPVPTEEFELTRFRTANGTAAFDHLAPPPLRGWLRGLGSLVSVVSGRFGWFVDLDVDMGWCKLTVPVSRSTP